MQAGKLRHRFTLQKAAQGTGEISAIYQTVGAVWGNMEGLGGIESPAIQSSADYRVRLRYRDDITSRHRLLLGSRAFDVTSVVDPDGRRRELLLLVKEPT